MATKIPIEQLHKLLKNSVEDMNEATEFLQKQSQTSKRINHYGKILGIFNREHDLNLHVKYVVSNQTGLRWEFYDDKKLLTMGNHEAIDSFIDGFMAGYEAA